MTDETGNTARNHLRAYINRIERLEEEKSALMEDIREVYAEAKGTGFDPKIMRQVIIIRKMEPDKRQEQEYVLDTYLSALGMLLQPSTVLEGAGVAGEDVAVAE